MSLGGGQPAARIYSPLGEDDDPAAMNGLGNKAISLKLCRNVLLRDISILNGALRTKITPITQTGESGASLECVGLTAFGKPATRTPQFAACQIQLDINPTLYSVLHHTGLEQLILRYGYGSGSKILPKPRTLIGATNVISRATKSTRQVNATS